MNSRFVFVFTGTFLRFMTLNPYIKKTRAKYPYDDWREENINGQAYINRLQSTRSCDISVDRVGFFIGDAYKPPIIYQINKSMKLILIVCDPT